MVARTGNSAGAGYMNTIINTLTADMINVGYQLMAQSNVVTNATNISNTIIWNIMKSPATNNQIGNDWFVAIGTDQNTNTWFWGTLFCGWNVAGTNLASQFVPANASANPFNTYIALANGFANTSVVLPNILTTGNVWCHNVAGANSIQTGGNGCNYIYTVTVDRLIISFANTAAANMNANATCLYFGTYDSFMPMSRDPYPLVQANIGGTQAPLNFGSSAGSSGSCPNEPMGIFTPNVSPGSVVGRNNFCACGPFLANFCTGFWDIYTGPRISKLIIGGGGQQGSIPTTQGTGGIRGLYKDMFGVGNPSPTGGTAIVAHTDQAYFVASGVQYNLTYLGRGTEAVLGVGAPGVLGIAAVGVNYPWVNLI